MFSGLTLGVSDKLALFIGSLVFMNKTLQQSSLIGTVAVIRIWLNKSKLKFETLQFVEHTKNGL